MSIHFLDWLFFAPPTFSAPWPLVDWHAWGHTAVQMKLLPNENKRSSSWIQTQMVCGLPLAEYHGNKHISSSNLPVWCSFLMVKNSFAKASSNVSTNSSPESRCGGPASPASTLPLMRRRALATQIAKLSIWETVKQRSSACILPDSISRAIWSAWQMENLKLWLTCVGQV